MQRKIASTPLTQEEKRRMLRVISRSVIWPRPVREIDAEIEAIRAARRTGGRHFPSS